MTYFIRVIAQFIGHSFSHRNCCNSSWLCDTNHARSIGSRYTITRFIEKLWDLCGFTRSCFTTYDDTIIVMNSFHNSAFFRVNRQIRSSCMDLIASDDIHSNNLSFQVLIDRDKIFLKTIIQIFFTHNTLVLHLRFGRN